MREQSPFVTIASCAIVICLALPILKKMNGDLSPYRILIVLFVFIPFAYSLVRLRWPLPAKFDDAFDNAAPFGCLIAVLVAIVAMVASFVGSL
jgi:hypothetical protein